MKNNLKIIALIFTIFNAATSCKVKKPTTQKNQINNTSQNTSSTNPAPYPTEPGTCVIQGYVLIVLQNDTAQKDEPCKSFPCRAKVVITKSSACGFGVHQKPVQGDTLEVNFIHSLSPSEEFKGVYKAQVRLPGLKQDQLFEAQMRIKLMMMDKLAYEIGNYDLVR
jgi:hypothetical protein